MGILFWLCITIKSCRYRSSSFNPYKIYRNILYYIIGFEDLQKGNLENLTYILPEILSRLVVKCSDRSKLKLLNFLNVIYLKEKKQNFRGVTELFIRLLNSSSLELKAKMFIPLLEFPILNEGDLGVDSFIEPFQIFTFTKDILNQFRTTINKEIIDNLLLVAREKGSKRKRAIFRLGTLDELNLFNKNQKKAFGEALWLHLDSNTGFPSDTEYYYATFINLPHPKNSDPKSLYKKYILNSFLPVQNLQDNKENSIGITEGKIQLCNEILKGIKSSEDLDLEWTNEEIIIIYNKILDWWNLDKKFLKNNSVTISKEFFSRFKHVNALISVMIRTFPVLFKESGNYDTLKNLINELQEYGVPNLQAKAAFHLLLSEKKIEIIKEIENAFGSRNQNILLDAAKSVIVILELHKQKDFKIGIEQLLQTLSLHVKWRVPDTLAIALDTFGNIVERYSDLITEETLSNILIGLKYLIKETHLTNQVEENDFGVVLLLRKYSASLTFKLKQYFTNLNLPIPPIINDWELVCTSLNEFDEIRNEWEN